jgi:hypothetical protein
VAIPLTSLKQKCCDLHLASFSVIEMDCLDDVGSTCDKVIECEDKYYLVEEKSITLSFLDACCKELNLKLDDYKYIEEEVSYLKINEVVELIQVMHVEVKRRILSDTIVNMTNTSAKKASNTTDILNKQFNNQKTSNMSAFYLYCNSGHPIDDLINRLLTRYKKTIFIECLKLKEKLEQECL